jgi:two-component system, LytTR family, response regulator
MTIRAMIVDDERHARQKMRTLLEQEHDVSVVGECRNGTEAVSAIREQKPDLVFLDIEMPGCDGFEVLRETAPAACQIVFVTAYDHYAVRAFEVQALDYLLKPFDRDRLSSTLERVRERLRSGEDLQERLKAFLDGVKPRSGARDRLMIRSSGRITFIKTTDVDWLEAADNYVRVHSGKESHLIRETMANLESDLDSRRFVRVHRSAIINVDAIEEIRSMFHGDYSIRLRTGAEIPLGRTFRERLEAVLGRGL